MACVTVTNVTVLDNPARFENPFQVSCHHCSQPPAAHPASTLHRHGHRNPFRPLHPQPPTVASYPTVNRRVPTQFEIEFECIAPIPDDIEWKLTCAASLHPCSWAALASLPGLPASRAAAPR